MIRRYAPCGRTPVLGGTRCNNAEESDLLEMHDNCSGVFANPTIMMIKIDNNILVIAK